MLEAVAGGEITAGEVERACAASMPWGSWDPSRPAAEAMRKAIGDLLGHAPATWADLEAQAAGLDTTAVASAFGHALGSGLLVVPGGEEDVRKRFAAEPSTPSARRMNGTVYVRWDGNTVDEVVLASEGVSRAIGLQDVSSVSFDECVLAAFVLTGTIWLVDAIGQSVILEPNQLMRGRELASEIRERIPDRVVDLRVTCSVGSSCRRRSRSTIPRRSGRCGASLETLAELREIGERILLLSFADHGKRGILAITDRRLIHVSHARTDRPIVEIPGPTSGPPR